MSGYDIERELSDVRQKVASMHGIELQTCVPSQVRLRLTQTRARSCNIMLQFPDNYPHELILMEIKSKTLPQKLTDLIVKLFDAEKARFVGGDQILSAIAFVDDYLSSNPLCICADEISKAKQLFDLSDESQDFFKIKQKKRQVHFAATSASYRLEARVSVPDDYPDEQVTPEIDFDATNMPETFAKYFSGQAKEIARRCVEPPLATNTKMKRPEGFHGRSAENWAPSPSLYPVIEFLTVNTKRYPTEGCGICKKRCFDATPPGSVSEQLAALRPKKKRAQSAFFDIERVYCGHIFHFNCLNKYMNAPPFTGKKCPQCGATIYHEKWKETEKIREERWAHHQAKIRELEEVSDFLS